MTNKPTNILTLIVALVAASGLAFLVGLSHYRRQAIRQKIVDIELLGGEIQTDQSYWNYVWEPVPQRGYITKYNPTSVALPPPDEARAEQKMKELGVKKIYKHWAVVNAPIVD